MNLIEKKKDIRNRLNMILDSIYSIGWVEDTLRNKKNKKINFLCRYNDIRTELMWYFADVKQIKHL